MTHASIKTMQLQKKQTTTRYK